MLIEKVKGEKYSQCRIPGIVITENGTLLAYYECRKSNSDWADIDIKIIRSTDDGNSWQTVTVFEGNSNTLNNPVMFVNENKLYFLFLRNYKTLFRCESKDDGQSFSTPEEIHIDCDLFYNVIAVGPGHGIVHNGKMIVPVWLAQNRDDPKAHRPSVISTLYSDNGKDWSLGDFIGTDILVNPSECALAVTDDNNILISIRNENGTNERAFATSHSGYDGWTDLHFDQAFPDPVCMGSMCHENGTVYHISCESKTARENLTVKISRDSFRSFDSIFVDTPAGYSDIAVRNNTLYILYERDCTNGGLYFKKIKSYTF